MTIFNPRALMEQAVEVMRKSVSERRADGKATPIVGAVLWKPKGPVETACRGELRWGDHAEFTLLERKNRHVPLDDRILFTTLEPCAPGARTHPKLSCAERIVLARIKEVWIGIEDPDPVVDRKGIKYLQENGVKVLMFDRDLQEQIQKDNKAFIEQAIERAAASREETEPKAVMLSTLEDAFAAAQLGDLSREALAKYRAISKIEDALGSPAFNRRLTQQGLLKEKNGILTPTGFGLLLFGTEPRTAMPQSGLLGTIHFADGTEETRDFAGPQVFAPEAALQWLKDKLPNPIDRSTARRGEKNEALFEIVRESVVNALVHRDYAIDGAKCQLIATPDSIVVKSPGLPVEPITLAQMQSFSAPMLSRNPILHYAFAKMELAEERGLGLKSIRTRAQSAGLPLPRFAWEAPYLVLTHYRSAAGIVQDLPPRVQARLKPDAKDAWQFIASLGEVTSPILMREKGFDERKAQRVLKALVLAGLLRRVGSGPATRYQVVSH